MGGARGCWWGSVLMIGVLGMDVPRTSKVLGYDVKWLPESLSEMRRSESRFHLWHVE
jgi:hypothetical protein